MPGDASHPKTCHRCGRTGSHAFRRTTDGLFECTTATACRVRARRQAGARQDGRGRLPTRRSLTAAGPGVAYVIGEAGPEREMVAEALRAATGMSVVPGDRSRATLRALASRNVRIIAVSATALTAVGFRNEFALRWHQPRLGSVPVLVFGDRPASSAAAASIPGVVPITIDGTAADLRAGLRRQIRAIDREALVESPA
jgi:hypothetical protein